MDRESKAPGSVDRKTLCVSYKQVHIFVWMEKYIKHTHALAVLLVLLLMYFATPAQCKWKINHVIAIYACADLCSFRCEVFQSQLMHGVIVVHTFLFFICVCINNVWQMMVFCFLLDQWGA